MTNISGIINEYKMDETAVRKRRLRSRPMPECETREEVFDHIAKTPGIHLRGLIETLNRPLGTLKYHVDRLFDAERIDAFPYKRFVRYFESKSYNPRAKLEISVLRSHNPKRLVDHLISNPGSTQREMAESLGISKSAASSNLLELTKNEIVTRQEKKLEEDKFYVLGLDPKTLLHIYGKS